MSTESLNCPNCGASLQVDEDKDVVVCSYCNSSIKIKKSDSTTSLVIIDSDVSEVSPETMEEIKKLLQGGKKIEAIKVYRGETEKSLKQSKQAIESISEELGLKNSPPPASTGSCLLLVVILLIWAVLLVLTPVIVGKILESIYQDSMSPKTVNNYQALSGVLAVVLSIAGFIVWASRGKKKKEND
ncbi:MAG: hypothetical protein APR54_07750 [Candidatus Cloacimonas sp. SDB]|nr:MAG: hypothetical protein APR54_07750 [Candidatus Cloacimonas sp. SDB]